MRVRALDNNHDWTLEHKLNSQAIAQNVKTALLCLYNDWFLDLESGIKWFNYLQKNPNLQNLQTDIKNAIFEVEGIKTIEHLNITLIDRVCLIELDYTDIFHKKNRININANNR